MASLFEIIEAASGYFRSWFTHNKNSKFIVFCLLLFLIFNFVDKGEETKLVNNCFHIFTSSFCANNFVNKGDKPGV